jgi:hypothetical protein
LIIQIAYYDPTGGKDNERRLTGKHETASIDKFSYGVNSPCIFQNNPMFSFLSRLPPELPVFASLDKPKLMDMYVLMGWMDLELGGIIQ